MTVSAFLFRRPKKNDFIGLDALGNYLADNAAALQKLANTLPGVGHPFAPPPPEKHPLRDAIAEVVFVVAATALLVWIVYGGVLEMLKKLFLGP